jgi:hypothetical protein
MFCAIPIEINDLLLVVTEFDHTPEQKLTYHQEYLPENFEVVEGYLVDAFNNDLSKQDFWELVDENQNEVINRVRDYFYSEEEL